MTLRCSAALAMISAILCSAPCAALAEPPRLAIAPTGALPKPQLAVQYEVQVRLVQGRGLARSLMDLGVDSDDAAAAARLAAAPMADSSGGGCQAKISFSKSAGGNGYHLVRVMLATDAARTIIERRDGTLAVASHVSVAGVPRLI